MKTVFQRICDDNKIHYGTRASQVMQIIIGEYSDRTHFLYEILQNAEDADATEISFHLQKDRLIITHDGRPFDEKDIVGVCGIAEGTKGDGTRIGHFGIGFKSVYAYTASPLIQSGLYRFTIRDYIFPQGEKFRKEIDTLTTIILPFNRPAVTRTVAFNEIKKALTVKLTAESILFLTSLSKINIDIEGRQTGIEIKRTVKSTSNRGKTRTIILSTRSTNTNTPVEKTTRYFVFSDRKKEASAVAFKIENQEIVPVENSRIYSFFPTAKEAHQKFYIHAPFDTTPGRDNFQEGGEYGRHNRNLVINVCQVLKSAVQYLQEKGFLEGEALEIILPHYRYPEDELLEPMYEFGISLINDGSVLLPTNDGNLVPINKLVTASSRIQSLFTSADLENMFHKEQHFLKTKIFSEGFKEFLIDQFTMRSIGWQDILPKLTAAVLESKNNPWLETLINALLPLCRTGYGVPFDFEDIPLVRLTSGAHVCARDGRKPVVYLNNPRWNADKIAAYCLKSPVIRTFYETVLRIPTFDEEQEFIEYIVPKYTRLPLVFSTKNVIQENIDDLQTVYEAIQKKASLSEKTAKLIILSDGFSWRKPRELFVPGDDSYTGYSLLSESDLKKMKFVSDEYLRKVDGREWLNLDFLKRIGCQDTIRKEIADKETYLEMVRKFLGECEEKLLIERVFSHKFVSDKEQLFAYYVGFPAVLDNPSRERSVCIAAFLNTHIREFKVTMEIMAADHPRIGKNAETFLGYSLMGLFLCYSPWMYGRGKKIPRCPGELEKDELYEGYYQFADLLEVLPFSEKNSGLKAWLDETFEDAKDRDLIRNMLSNPEEVAALAKRMAAEKRRKTKIKKASEQILNADVEDQGPLQMIDVDEYIPITSSGIERRKSKLKQVMTASSADKDKEGRYIHLTAARSNQQEKLFLLNEYAGKCQICRDMIIKSNGKPYFEAVNIISEETLPEDQNGAAETGWNSLCLCPSCAARFRYGTRKISGIYTQALQMDVIADSTEAIEIAIELPLGIQTAIHYSPRHFLALKTAFQLY